MKRVGQYGTGFLSRIKRVTGDVIAYRWHEDGKERKRILGLASSLNTEAAVYGAAETYYLADTNLRLQYGQAFATQAAQNPRLQRVSFWTTPGGGPNNEELNSAYPFTIEDFLPPPR